MKWRNSDSSIKETTRMQTDNKNTSKLDLLMIVDICGLILIILYYLVAILC